MLGEAVPLALSLSVLLTIIGYFTLKEKKVPLMTALVVIGLIAGVVSVVISYLTVKACVLPEAHSIVEREQP